MRAVCYESSLDPPWPATVFPCQTCPSANKGPMRELVPNVRTAAMHAVQLCNVMHGAAGVRSGDTPPCLDGL